METVVRIVGSAPGDPPRPLEVYLNQNGADGYILQGLLNAFARNVEDIPVGGTVSLLVTRAAEPTEDNPFPTSSGSFAIVHPDGSRQVWDFNTERCEVMPLG